MYLTTPPSWGAVSQDYWMVAKYVNKKKCWQITSTLTCCSCCNLQCCGFLLLSLIIMWSHAAPKCILREFDVTQIRPRPAWVTLPWNVDMEKFALSRKWEIIWTGGLPHLSGLPYLPGVPLLHVNRPLKVSPSPFLQFQELNHSPFIIWVNLVPLESRFYDLISCYYFCTWLLQCQM